jgi:hypothetical protein
MLSRCKVAREQGRICAPAYRVEVFQAGRSLDRAALVAVAKEHVGSELRPCSYYLSGEKDQR